MRKKILIGIVTVFVLAGIGVSYLLMREPKFKSIGTIKIVTSNPMRVIEAGNEISGYNFETQSIVNAVRLAVEEVNSNVAGYKIEVVVEDDGDEKGQWQEAMEEDIAKRAAADPDVMVYLGTYNSGAAKISIPITNKAGLVQISPIDTWPGLTKPGFWPGEPGIFYPTGVRTFFRVCPADDLQGTAGAIWVGDLGFKKIYIFDDGEAYGKGIADLFREKSIDLGLNVMGQETINRGNAREKLVQLKILIRI